MVGVARRAWNDAALREILRPFVQDRKDCSDTAWRQFAKSLHCVSGDFSVSTSETYATLRTKIKQVQRADYIPENVLFHLSVPPHL
jgi:glucose-6-phosphate 1-dehydrogenase